ncbi:tetratricopeptide repeat protein [Actinomadura roseirufa]|uniref:tetratricopeptide repeat protein n=1 Tax=Actinomadura roseirufa TaxID=2094049 RepID=UPI0010410AED|nr:tetratricopeptide repeat protein [Actinomadura roseirufa]
MSDVSAAVFTAWRASGEARRAPLDGLGIPRDIALRSRYLHLLDPEAPPGPWDPGLTREHWDEIIRVETDLDRAVRRDDLDGARDLCARLRDLEPSAGHRVVTVHARLALGDVARARDDAEGAVGEYEAVLAICRDDGYRFGRMRALVALGYVTLMYHSAGAARTRFGEALDLAHALGDLGYGANAALGLAECHERLGDLPAAADLARTALAAFDDLGNALGRANAAGRLGAVLHRLGDAEGARACHERAFTDCQRVRNPMGITNALSGLADIMLDEGRHDGAEEYFLAALRTAEHAGLARSRAHALQDLGRVAHAREDWAASAERFELALAAYQDLDELLGMGNAAHRLAQSYERLGDPAESLRVRVQAVFAVEEYRATHRDERSQAEYRARFGATYSMALEGASRHGYPGTFALVADCLAGRRLAGLLEETVRLEADGRERSSLSDLLERADRNLTGETGRRARVVRSLGVPAAPAPEGTPIDDMLAALYLPPAESGDGLLDALPGGCHVLQVLLDPQDGSRLRWLWRDAGGEVRLGGTELTERAVELIRLLQGNDDRRAALRPADLGPLSALLPDGLRDALAAGGGHRLLLVPVGELWLVPWSAVPVTASRMLGEAACYVLCPSLTVQRRLASRDRAAPARPQRVHVWRSPLIRRHALETLETDAGWDVEALPSAAAARDCFGAGVDAMIVTAHGRPAPGPIHYLELDRDARLRPVDLIGRRPPHRLVAIACWGGAVPDRPPTDPLSLATIALAGGSAEVLATVGELGDTFVATRYVEEFLAAMPGRPIWEALHEATRWLLGQEGVRAERVHHWAPLVPMGTF